MCVFCMNNCVYEYMCDCMKACMSGRVYLMYMCKYVCLYFVYVYECVLFVCMYVYLKLLYCMCLYVILKVYPWFCVRMW